MTRLLCLLLLAGHAQAGDFWSDLWTTADQRGDRLLRQGQAAAAARVYTDPRRRGHAEIMAGDYAAAARAYATYDDADAHYNRGIALAHLGRLPEALQAFDAALARAPGDRDARHNRDLVARQITPPPSGEGPVPDRGRGSLTPALSQGERENSPPPPGEGPGERERPVPERGRGSLTPALSQGERGNSPPPSGEGLGERERPVPDRGRSSLTPALSQGERENSPPPPGEGPGERERSVPERGRSSLTPALSQGERGNSPRPPGEGPGERERPVPERGRDSLTSALAQGERGQAKPMDRTAADISREQWLRQIPDDPGGLLRRKFMIEHTLRQNRR